MDTVAIVGGGAAGIGAARRLLKEGADVLMLEAAPRLGGNCRADEVHAAEGWVRQVDMGVSDFNLATFHEFSALVRELRLETRPICTDASFSDIEGNPLCHVQQGEWHFGDEIRQPERFLTDLKRFQANIETVLEDDRYADWSVDRYLDSLSMGREFREVYVYARAMGCFPMPDCHPREYRVRDLARFWKIHGVIGRIPPNRHCIVGGMHRYVEAFRDWFVAHGGELHCAMRVIGIVRHAHKVEIRAVDRHDRHCRFEVSQVILANNAHEALPLIEQPSVTERKALGGFPYHRARLVMHRDASLVGGRVQDQGAFNYVVPTETAPRVRPTITFYPNRLAGFAAGEPDVYVTMNPHRDPAPDSIVAERFFLHPLLGAASDEAAAMIHLVQGQNRTWFAGSYLRSPCVHESALVSGIDVARRLARGERKRFARRLLEQVA